MPQIVAGTQDRGPFLHLLVMPNPIVSFLRPPERVVGEEDEGGWALTLIVRLRTIHILFELALLFPALRSGWMFSSDIPWYIGLLAGLTIFNILTYTWRRLRFNSSPAFLLLQVVVDLTAMALLFGISGGLTNPVHSLIHFQIGLAGILLPTSLALAVLAWGCGLLAVLGWSTQSLSDAYTWVGPLGPNLAYEGALAIAVSGLSIFAARLNRHYRESLREARVRIRQQDRLRAAGAVASGFCHELASPLNAVGLLTDRLRRKTAPGQPAADLHDEWDELQESLARCGRIVHSMAGTPWDSEELGLQTADAGLLLRKIAQDWSGRAPLRLAESVTPGYPVAAPAIGLAQALMNLLRNADEASPASEVIEVGIRLVTHGEKKKVIISVVDRGSGVEPSALRALGTPFNSRKGSGRGLGLFSTLHLTESLGGSLVLAPRGGGGTEATLTLPCASDEDDSSETGNANPDPIP